MPSRKRKRTNTRPQHTHKKRRRGSKFEKGLVRVWETEKKIARGVWRGAKKIGKIVDNPIVKTGLLTYGGAYGQAAVAAIESEKAFWNSKAAAVTAKVGSILGGYAIKKVDASANRIKRKYGM